MQSLNFVPPGKRMPKLSERAKAALEEQHDNSKKRKQADQSTEAVPKKVCSVLQTGTTRDSSVPSSPASAVNKSHRATVEDVVDEYDELQRVRERSAPTTQSKGHKSRKPTVEDVEDDGDKVGRGQSTATTPSPELDSDDELSAFVLQHFIIISSWQSEKKQKEWSAPIYAFFEPVPRNIEVEGRPAHEFKCSARGCKGTVRRYLDTKDAGSTGNLRRHAKLCWGTDVVKAADDARNVDDVRTKIRPGLLKDGSITTAFKRKGNGQVTYSHCQHTCQEIK